METTISCTVSDISIDYLVSTGKELKEYLLFVISVKKFAETK